MAISYVKRNNIWFCKYVCVYMFGAGDEADSKNTGQEQKKRY